MNVNVNKILVCSLKNEFHFAVGRGYGYLYTCYYRGKHSLVGLGYHSRSWILCCFRTKRSIEEFCGYLELRLQLELILCCPQIWGLWTNCTGLWLSITVKAETFHYCTKLKALKWFEVIVCDQCHPIKISKQWKIFQLKTTIKSFS